MKARTQKFESSDKQSRYTIREYDDFEFVNPIEHIASMFIDSIMSFDRNILNLNGFNAPDEIVEELLFKRAIIEWEKKLERYKSIKIPESLYTLLESESKKEQISALKGLSLTSDELISFIFMASEKYGYKYSQYKAQHNHKGLDETSLPELIHLKDDGTLVSIGNTTLTEGQQKQVIEHRRVTVSKFIDNDKNWHCFFLTFRSLSGKETYKNGQPHLHYISDKWNFDRKVVVEQLTNKDYSLPSLPHIDFHTHRNPRGSND